MDLLKAFIKKRCVEGMWWSADMGEIRLAYRKYVEHRKGTEVTGEVFEREIEENFGRTNERYVKYAVHLRTDPYSEESDSEETSSEEPASKPSKTEKVIKMPSSKTKAPKAKTVTKMPSSKAKHTLLTGLGVFVTHEDPNGLMETIEASGKPFSPPTGPFKVFVFRLGRLCDLLGRPRPERSKMRVMVAYVPLSEDGDAHIWVLLEESFLVTRTEEPSFGNFTRMPHKRDMRALKTLGDLRFVSEVAV